MEISFNAKNVYQSILGAVSQPERRDQLLAKVSNGLMNNKTLDPTALQKGVQDAVDSGLLTVEDANNLFPGVLDNIVH
ncbi:MAG: hypothetical protein HQL68_02155 [Magnetococcales bacterium]|nr:hypothetical protein [Magnetococcales bacterium]